MCANQNSSDISWIIRLVSKLQSCKSLRNCTSSFGILTCDLRNLESDGLSTKLWLWSSTNCLINHLLPLNLISILALQLVYFIFFLFHLLPMHFAYFPFGSSTPKPLLSEVTCSQPSTSMISLSIPLLYLPFPSLLHTNKILSSNFVIQRSPSFQHNYCSAPSLIFPTYGSLGEEISARNCKSTSSTSLLQPL